MVPVLMFHNVSPYPEKYPKPSLVTSLELFHEFVKRLAGKRFHTVSLNDLYEYKTSGKSLPPKPIILTFDDGFLDNYTFAAPILKKYGFSATIFVSHDFVEKTEVIRPTIEDYWSGKFPLKNLQMPGYCSIGELKKMQEDGVMDIQAHGKSHTWYFKSDKLIGLYKQIEFPKWMEWNYNPDNKPFTFTMDERKVPRFHPVFENAPSLGVDKAYIPSGEAIEKIIEGANDIQLGGEKPDISFLDEIIKNYPGQFESDKESDNRISEELIFNKEWLETVFNKKVDFLAWPNGKYTNKTWEKAKNHYKAVTKPGDDFINLRKDDPFIIKRMGGVDQGGNRIVRKLKILKLLSKIEYVYGSKKWGIVFIFIKVLQKTRLIRFSAWSEPSSYKYNFDLIQPHN